MSEDPTGISALHRSLSEEDISGAFEAYTRLQTASATDLLERLETAIENDQSDEARTALTQLTDSYQSVRPRESAKVATVEAARETDELSFEETQELTKALREAGQTKLLRSKALTATTALLDAGTDNPPDTATVIEAIEAARQQEQSLDQTLSATESLVDKVTLPPAIELLALSVPSSVPVGENASVTATVANTGDSTATGVNLTLDLPETLSASQTSFVIGQVGDDPATVSTEISGTTPTVTSLGATVTSANATQVSDVATIVVGDGKQDQPTEETGLSRFDTNGNKRIEITEVLAAIKAFNRNQPIGGVAVGITDVLRVIEAFNTGESV
ncbi:COG1361 family protein [Haloarcula halophila]|uniref:hypothetical protein n=1 Tax=Halomicroarcula sp. GCM10025335 TaxID=3252668 RepID=UPI003623ECEE